MIGVLLTGFAVTEGFDMGVGMLMRLFGRNDVERRVMINTIAPHWDGNQVWLITAGGALFAAWPMVCAAVFSGFYIAIILVLASLFFRPIGFDYRSKIDNARWRNMWDWGIFIGSFISPVVIGVAFGNLLQGVPFHVDEYLRLYYTGNFFQLLNSFGLLAGIVSLAMFLTQGDTYLQMRTGGDHAVSVYHAVKHDTQRQPDPVGRDVESEDVESHDGGGDHFRADCAALYHLMLLIRCSVASPKNILNKTHIGIFTALALEHLEDTRGKDALK